MASGACGAGRRVRLVEAERTEGVGNRLEAGLLVDIEAPDNTVSVYRRAKDYVFGTHTTPFTVPPFSTQRRSPALLNASDTGNSPSEEIGFPMRWMLVGDEGSIEKRVTVFDPAYRSSKSIPKCIRGCQCSTTHVDGREHLAVRGCLDGALREQRVRTVWVSDAVRTTAASANGPVEVLQYDLRMNDDRVGLARRTTVPSALIFAAMTLLRSPSFEMTRQQQQSEADIR